MEHDNCPALTIPADMYFEILERLERRTEAERKAEVERLEEWLRQQECED